MIDDLKKSFNEIIYERTTSPFYGRIITSWLIWNWRIIYLTFFISEKTIKLNKIDFILNNYSDVNHILTFPIISTFILLTIIPFISNGAFWLSLKFNKWKIDQKNIVDNNQLLTIGQSIELRVQLGKQEQRFSKLVEGKNLEIRQLNSIIEKTKTSASETKTQTSNEINDDDLNELSNRIKNDYDKLRQYEEMIGNVQNGY